tara:strand:+ start:88 stop:420 length:333 start_codon:yes stop_codon:yes gene_type:complete
MKYTWKISQLNCKIKETIDGKELNNVVKTIHWRYELEDGGKRVEIYGAEDLFRADADNFIEYNNLKESDVIGWLEDNVDVDDLKSNLNQQMNLIKNPVDETLPIPWENEE